MILASTQVHEPLLCVLRSRQDVVCLESGPYACLLGRVSGTWSQNSSENYLIAALAARGVAWLMGQRNSFGTLVFFFFHLACLGTPNLVSWLLVWMELILNRWVIVCEHRWRRNTECTGRAHTWKWAREEENDARGKGREKSEHSPGRCRKCPLLEISR